MRERIKKKYNTKHNIITFKEGDFATLVIEGNDRTATNPRRMLVKIYEVVREDVYKLQYIYGILKRCVSIVSLNHATKIIIYVNLEAFKLAPIMEITLHAAAYAQSNITYISITCPCKKSCDIKRYICFKNNKKCT